MQFFLLITLCLAIATAFPLETFDVVENDDGKAFVLVPVSREKRQTSWNVNNNGASLGHKGTVFDNPGHRLDGSGYVAKSFNSPGLRPDQLGGRFDYLHKQSGSTAFVGADHTRHFGTDVKVGAGVNLYNKKDLNVDVTGQYGRHFGGPGGTGRPDAGVFLNVNKKF